MKAVAAAFLTLVACSEPNASVREGLSVADRINFDLAGGMYGTYGNEGDDCLEGTAYDPKLDDVYLKYLTEEEAAKAFSPAVVEPIEVDGEVVGAVLKPSRDEHGESPVSVTLEGFDQVAKPVSGADEASRAILSNTYDC